MCVCVEINIEESRQRQRQRRGWVKRNGEKKTTRAQITSSPPLALLWSNKRLEKMIRVLIIITFGSYWKLVLETLEIDKSRQQSGGLNIGVEDEEADKVVEWGDSDHGLVP